MGIYTGEKYRPSNGTAGEGFMEAFCYHCIHEKWSHTQNDADLRSAPRTNIGTGAMD